MKCWIQILSAVDLVGGFSVFGYTVKNVQCGMDSNRSLMTNDYTSRSSCYCLLAYACLVSEKNNAFILQFLLEHTADRLQRSFVLEYFVYLSYLFKYKLLPCIDMKSSTTTNFLKLTYSLQSHNKKLKNMRVIKCS